MDNQTDKHPHMDSYAEKLTEKYYGQKPLSIAPLGGGFYGRVFLAELSRAPYKAVIKIYLYSGLNEREAAQLKILAGNSVIRMPEVYFIHHSDNEIPVDALLMEYIDGINAGGNIDLAPEIREKIADQMVDNLIACHRTIHPEGFGEINAGPYEKDWRVCFRRKADTIFPKAADMYAKGKISDSVYGTVQKAYQNFDRIFSQPVDTARLIHGDYNTWNILLNNEATECAAVIDPFNCSWADSELDLYQLNNANGKYYGLLDKYRAKVPLSSNFEIKNCFYELFTEIMHYYDADIDPAASGIPETARKLEIQMKKIGI